jgi:hypothetical protein
LLVRRLAGFHPIFAFGVPAVAAVTGCSQLSRVSQILLPVRLACFPAIFAAVALSRLDQTGAFFVRAIGAIRHGAVPSRFDAYRNLNTRLRWSEPEA